MPLDEAVLDTLFLTESRGGRKPSKSIEVQVIGTLEEGDLASLETAPAPRPTVLSIKATHHKLARLIASGLSDTKASQISGYSPAWISSLKTNPAFAELISYYRVNTDQIHFEVEERMKVLGLAALDELQRRLEEAPNEFSRREIMEMTELLLAKKGGGGEAVQAGPAVQLNLKFVNAGSGEPRPRLIEGDGE